MSREVVLNDTAALSGRVMAMQTKLTIDVRMALLALVALLGAPAAQAQRTSAQPADTIAPQSGMWGDFATLSGPDLTTATSLRGVWYPKDDDTQPATVSETVTVRGRVRSDAWQIQIPADPARSGWSGDFSRGVLRLYLVMPNQPEPVFAARFYVGGASPPANLQTNANLSSAKLTPPTGNTAASSAASPTPTISSRQRPTGVLGGLPGNSAPAGSTAPAASTSASGTRQLNVPGAQGSIAPALKQVPGTTITAITDVTLVSATIAWKPAIGASGYQIHASANHFEHTVDGPSVPPPAGNDTLPSVSASLSDLLPGLEYDVWVTVQYRNGPPGVSDHETLTTLPPQNPQGFTASEIAPGIVRLQWQPVAGAHEYMVEGSNLPRMRTTDTAVAVSNLLPGTHEWSVITIFGTQGGLFDDIHASTVMATLSPNTAGRGHYRVVINGFRVDQETMDDPLQRDGKGDEVFIAVKVEEFDRTSRQRLGHAVVPIAPNLVFGDTNGFPTRVRAGTTGDTGGLRRGNAYPGPNPALRSRNPAPLGASISDLPFVVWDGYLEAGVNALLISPAIFEWDNGASGGSYERWLSDFETDTGAADREFVRPDLTQGPDPVTPQFSASQIAVVLTYTGVSTHDSSLGNLALGDGGDRPIGFVWAADALQFGGYYRYPDRVLVLTREAIENELAPRNTSGSLPPGVIAIRYRDDPKGDGSLGGDYTLYVQVERVQ